MQVLSNILESNREFLYRTQLRSLRNLYWLPKSIQKTIIGRLDLYNCESRFLLSWLEVTTDRFLHFWQYYCWLNLPHCSYVDVYKNCYDSDYNLTTLGQELHNDAATLVLNQG
jgi:hypothetical protein